MSASEADVSNAVQTELKLHMTQQLHRKGYLSDEVYAGAMAMILSEAKNTEPGCCHVKPPMLSQLA
ncbi:MAG: hypothetical protein FWC70_12950 [Defluviitaleaceae bacterium]|nr:hypothetical protein [Defluviitaleaceae bacterium]